jgi:hypothetical protein
LDRTRFLKTCTLLAAASMLGGQPALAAMATSAAKPPKFRAGEPGTILVSQDQGASWTVHLKLGPSYHVKAVQEEGTDTIATIEFKALEFKLKLSADGKNWVTD